MIGWLVPVATSTLVVALAEIGDRTMLLAIMLVTRFRRPWAVLGGILMATVANHAVAAAVGAEAAGLLASRAFRIAIAVGFIIMAAWTLVPDKLDDADKNVEAAEEKKGHGAFVTTLVSFFVVEIGDKTQIATMALAARYHAIVPVAAGTTLGMMLANVPVVLASERLIGHVPLRLARQAAALLLAAQGVWQLLRIFALV